LSFQAVVSVAAKRKMNDPNAALHSGTLLDLYQISQNVDQTHSINILDLPMGDTSVAIPPQYRYVGEV
jgi:hypothetical protein